MYTSALLATVTLSYLAYAQDGKLDKPPLHDNLDYLKQGLMDHLPLTHNTNEQWNGFIPEACQQMAQEAKLDPNDVTAWNVTYDDCNAPWVLCHHKDSPSSAATLMDQFGRVPVHMRQWVRHVIALPSSVGGHAYNSGGNIAMFDNIDNAITVFIHETAHSLDLLGAYTDKPLSSSDYWITQYGLDPNVPDPYSQTNQVEDVAQTTVVATFDENVPGGFVTVEQDNMATFHQYATLQTEADAAAPGNILLPGGQCTHRLDNSPPVAQSGAPASRIKGRTQTPAGPDVSLPNNIEVIPPTDFDTKEHCKHSW